MEQLDPKIGRLYKIRDDPTHFHPMWGGIHVSYLGWIDGSGGYRFRVIDLQEMEHLDSISIHFKYFDDFTEPDPLIALKYGGR